MWDDTIPAVFSEVSEGHWSSSNKFKKYDDVPTEWEQRNYIFIELLKMSGRE